MFALGIKNFLYPRCCAAMREGKIQGIGLIDQSNHNSQRKIASSISFLRSGCIGKNKLYTATARAKSYFVQVFFIDDGERLRMILRGGICNQQCLKDDLILSLASLIAVSHNHIISIVGIACEESASINNSIPCNHISSILLSCFISILHKKISNSILFYFDQYKTLIFSSN
jgi:hypothetical protein